MGFATKVSRLGESATFERCSCSRSLRYILYFTEHRDSFTENNRLRLINFIIKTHGDSTEPAETSISQRWSVMGLNATWKSWWMSCVTRRRFARPPCEDPRDSTSWYRNLDFLSALTCPTPSHYSIIYYRCSLWESKHRSHVTLCDQSNDGGGTSSSSSSSSRIPLLPSFVRLLPLRHSTLRLVSFTEPFVNSWPRLQFRRSPAPSSLNFFVYPTVYRWSSFNGKNVERGRGIFFLAGSREKSCDDSFWKILKNWFLRMQLVFENHLVEFGDCYVNYR